MLMVFVTVQAIGLDRLPVDQLPKSAELPNPFVLANGSTVKTPEDWKKRRDEIADIILTYEFGQLPPKVDHVKSSVVKTIATTRPTEMPGVTEQDVLLETGPKDEIKIPLKLYIPASPLDSKNRKFPIIIRGDLGWGPVKNEILYEVVNRGYILAQFDRTVLHIDKNAIRTGGVFDAWPDYKGSASSAWAWGYHRVVDYVITRDDVDAKKIAITGHSRGGKAVLLAGALDERIAMVAPNGSGCGGAGCYRFQAPKSEAIENIVAKFPYWFEPNFHEFIGHVDQLPFDQHYLKALCAPRAYLETNALGDLWANPEGSQQSWRAGKEVFDFLGATDQIGIGWREGKHEHNLRDWSTLIDFADYRFFGKQANRSFTTLAFPASEKKFSWTKPQ